jgi:transposase InsO family protein
VHGRRRARRHWKKLGRIKRMGKRIPGSSHNPIKAGWEYLFVAIDDHARLGFTDMYPDETKASAAQFLRNAVAYFRSLGVKARRILTDNGSCFRSQPFADACRALRLKHSFTRPYRPQTNGKAERFIQSALREWAYGIPYSHSSERTAMLERWMHHYNWHRPHQGIKGLAPTARLTQSKNNLLTLHS